MANIHVLTGSQKNVYTVVVHLTVPVGNNSAGVAWSTAIVNAGLNKTQLATGTGPGQIVTADASAIAAGTLFEGSFQWGDNPALTAVQRQASLDQAVTQLQAELTATMQASLRYFGMTR